MNKGVVLIENRPELVNTTIDKHFKFIPKGWGFKLFDNLDVKSLNDYNTILTSEDFWEQIPFDKILIIQHDSELLREGINDFLGYDYIGAPWKFQEHGGNGGLSFRNKAAMISVIKENTYRNASLDGYEDVYFSNRLKESKYNLANRQICFDFSCETIFKLGTLGAHAIDKYLTPSQCLEIRTQYK